MHAAPRPSRGNWLWLPSALATTAAFLAVLFSVTASGGGCAPPVAREPGLAWGAGTAASQAGDRAAAQTTLARRAAAVGGTAWMYRNSHARAVYYDPGHAAGSCGLGPFRRGGAYAAVSRRRFAHGTACGTYLDIRGAAGDVRAEVVDLCPSCRGAAINLSRGAFRRVSDALGSTAVTYSAALNPALRGPLRLRIGRSASGRHLVLVVNHGNRIASVAIAAAAVTRKRAGPSPLGASLPPDVAAPHTSAWRNLSMDSHGWWATSPSTGTGPFDVRITDTLGHRAIVPGVSFVSGIQVRSSVWMYHAEHHASLMRRLRRTVIGSGSCH